jgi:hypothetical protein
VQMGANPADGRLQRDLNTNVHTKCSNNGIRRPVQTLVFWGLSQ